MKWVLMLALALSFGFTLTQGEIVKRWLSAWLGYTIAIGIYLIDTKEDPSFFGFAFLWIAFLNVLLGFVLNHWSKSRAD